MIKGREHFAETLNEVLEVIRQRRQTGLLSVECTHDGRYEEGEVYVQGGQPVYARAGQLGGQEALTKMLSWRRLQFAFLPDAGRSATHSTMPVTNGRLPSSPSGALTTPRFPAVSSSGPLPALDQRSGPLASEDETPEAGSIPGLEWIVPRKLGGERDVMALPLTRPQRSVYLLIDGRRSVADLARCTRKSMQEIERLLFELRERGLITI